LVGNVWGFLGKCSGPDQLEGNWLGVTVA